MTCVDVAVALIPRRGLWFAQKRGPGPVLPGLWEFPGGKLEPLETPEQALVRELREEVGWAPRRTLALPVLRHAYPDRVVQLHPFLCHGASDLEAPRTALAWGWFSAAQLARLSMPEANLGLLGMFSTHCSGPGYIMGLLP